jgi:MraZ protein
VFRGLTAIHLDEKGRISIPKRYRKNVQAKKTQQLVITIDTEVKCLLLYPLEAWEQIEEKLENLPSFHPVTRRIQRLLIGHATEVDSDLQGRVLLPPVLREYAGLSKNVMLVGQGKKFEIWDETYWQAQRTDWLTENLTQQMPESLSSLSL